MAGPGSETGKPLPSLYLERNTCPRAQYYTLASPEKRAPSSIINQRPPGKRAPGSIIYQRALERVRPAAIYTSAPPPWKGCTQQHGPFQEICAA
eukprot:73261-Chlamydomonas_euryale.AAC.1